MIDAVLFVEKLLDSKMLRLIIIGLGLVSCVAGGSVDGFCTPWANGDHSKSCQCVKHPPVLPDRPHKCCPCKLSITFYTTVTLSRKAVPAYMSYHGYMHAKKFSRTKVGSVYLVAVTGSTWRLLEVCHVHPVTATHISWIMTLMNS